MNNNMWYHFSEKKYPENWDITIQKLDFANVFQSSDWAEYKELSGWDSEKLVYIDKDEIKYALQIFKKVYFNFLQIIWVPGGIALADTEKNIELDRYIYTLAQKLSKNNYINYFRINFHQPQSEKLIYLTNKYINKSKVRINSGYTIIIDIDKDSTDVLAQMSKKHRYYVRKSMKEDVNWIDLSDDDSISKFVNAYNNMLESKKFHGESLTTKNIGLLRSKLNNKMILFSGMKENKLITSCIILIYGETAFYYLAVTTPKGRQLNISYAMIYESILYLKKLGIKKFDFGGINPSNIDARGVDHFKKGFGGEIIEYFGEYEWSKNRLISNFVNKAIKYKRGSF